MKNYSIATIIATHQALIRVMKIAGIDYEHGQNKVYYHFKAELNKYLPTKYFAARDLVDGTTEFAIFDTEGERTEWICSHLDDYNETDEDSVGEIDGFEEFVNDFVGDDYDSICSYFVWEDGSVKFSLEKTNKDILSA